ncbi:MAG: hypothetical protein ACRD3A_12670 [Terriglobales bacterium]
MSFSALAFYTLWIAPALLMALLAAVMMRKRLHRELPAFFSYAVFTAARTPILFFVFHQHPDVYAYVYQIAEGVSAVVGFASIYEVFRHLFGNHEAARRLGILLFRWTAGAFVLLAVVAAASQPQADSNRLATAIVALTQGVRLVQCGLLLFLFVFSFFSGLAWRSHLFGIAVGFGLFAGVQLATVAMQAHLGVVNDRTLVWVNMASYNCAVLVWVAYLLAPQRAEVMAAASTVAEVKGWNRALLQFLQR